MRDLFDLSGRTALVTGATRGLGRSMAKGLAGAGATVIITGRDPSRCEAAAKELRNETGAEILPLAGHMGEWNALGELVERVLGRVPRVDILVNNAGINPAFVAVTDLTEAYFDKVYAVNVRGPVRLAGLIAPHMRDAGGGSIVNVVTVGCYHGAPGIGTYTSAKAALLNWTRTMAREWADWKIRVNALAPGPFWTDMMRSADLTAPGFTSEAARQTLQKRLAEPEEIIGAVLYLASDASSFMTGEDLVVAGGMPS